MLSSDVVFVLSGGLVFYGIDSADVLASLGSQYYSMLLHVLLMRSD